MRLAPLDRPSGAIWVCPFQAGRSLVQKQAACKSKLTGVVRTMLGTRARGSNQIVGDGTST